MKASSQPADQQSASQSASHALQVGLSTCISGVCSHSCQRQGPQRRQLNISPSTPHPLTSAASHRGTVCGELRGTWEETVGCRGGEGRRQTDRGSQLRKVLRRREEGILMLRVTVTDSEKDNGTLLRTMFLETHQFILCHFSLSLSSPPPSSPLPSPTPTLHSPPSSASYGCLHPCL